MEMFSNFDIIIINYVFALYLYVQRKHILYVCVLGEGYISNTHYLLQPKQ
jgi:hypothetical protein